MSLEIQLSEEQTMLLETAQTFCRRHSSIEKVRANLNAPNMNEEAWNEIAGLGWLSINIPVEYGGLGLGFGSVVPVMESMGRYLMSTPYAATVIAAEVLSACGTEAQKKAHLPDVAEGSVGSLALTEEDGSWLLRDVSASAEQSGDKLALSGQKYFVTDADAADFFLASVQLSGEPRLVLIRADQVGEDALARETVIDETRRSYTLALDGIEVGSDQLLPGTDFEWLELTSILMTAAEISGGLAGVLHTIVDYLNTRKAFDRLIGSYQALKHPTVDILLGLEGCRSHLYHAATMIDTGSRRAVEIAVRMLKAQGSKAFAYAGDRAVQFHGGLGFTHECDAQLYLRRALWCQYQFGDERHQRQLLASLLLNPGASDAA